MNREKSLKEVTLVVVLELCVIILMSFLLV